MMSRREVVTVGVLGTLSSGAAPETAEAEQPDAGTRAALQEVKTELEELKGHFHTAFIASSLDRGRVGRVKERIETFLKSAGKFPEFCEIGTSVFFDIYEWHIKHQQQVTITRVAEQRLMIQFMFTQLLVRWENDSNYVGAPYDR